MSKVSIVIPVYNTEKYLHECLDSVCNQTFKDIEIICVDDGSTDKSLAVLKQYQQKDDRIKILEQKNKGGGAARNYGLSIATGKYVIFLDSDDFFSEVLIDALYAESERTNADITICQTQNYNTHLKYLNPTIGGVLEWNIPKTSPFSYNEMPDRIFNTFRLAPFNKLYRKSFITEKNIKFQEVMRCNDVYFVMKSLIQAEKIAVVKKVMVFYRYGGEGNCQSTINVAPFSAYEAYMSVKSMLMKLNKWDEVKYSFLNISLWGCLDALKKLKGKTEYDQLCLFLQKEGWKNLGIDLLPINKCQTKSEYLNYKFIQETSVEKYFSKQNCIKRRVLLCPIRFMELFLRCVRNLRYNGLKNTISIINFIIYNKTHN